MRQARKGNQVRPPRWAVPRLECANSFTVPSGRWPARGWFLVDADDYATLNKYTSKQLVIGDPNRTQVTLNGLYVVQAQSVSTGLTSDGSNLYLVEVTDARGLLYSPWFARGTTSQYNSVAPAYPGEYYSASMNGGSAWTWSGMVGDLWVQMPELGAYGGLPSTPAGTPQNFLFPGVSVLEALCSVLDLLGMTVACDLASSTPYTVVTSGATDAAFTAKETLYRGVLEDDALWVDVGAGRVPGSVVVYFHTVYQYYGSEETVRRDSLQWSSTPSYSVTVPSPGGFSSAPGVAYLWDDFQVRLDVNGTPLAADIITAAALAQERVTQFFNKIYSGTSGYMSRRYTGTLPFATGSQVDAVRWSQTQNSRQSWVTDLARGWVWDDVVFNRDPEEIVGTRDDTE